MVQGCPLPSLLPGLLLLRTAALAIFCLTFYFSTLKVSSVEMYLFFKRICVWFRRR